MQEHFCHTVHGTFENCYNKCNVTGTLAGDYEGVGGIVGGSGGDMNILNCYNEGTIINKSDPVSVGCMGAGGIIGEFRGGGTLYVENCYNAGDIISANYASGILGADWAEGIKNISNCCNVGKIIGRDKNREFDISCKRGANVIFTNSYYLQQNNAELNASDATSFNMEEVNDVIEKLNDYIVKNADTTTNWKRWTIGARGYPVLVND